MLEFIGERIRRRPVATECVSRQLKWQMVLAKATKPAAFAPSAALERGSSEEDQ